MRIDAHVHVWNLDAGGYDWPNASVPALHRNFDVEDLASLLDRFDIDGVVLVQAADTAADSDNMFMQAAMNDRVRGVVAWLDLGADPEHFAVRLERMRQREGFCGLRNLSHVKPDPHWIRGTRQQSNIAMLAAQGVPLDMVTSSHLELGEAAHTLDNTPDAAIVLDHLGKPPIGGPAADRAEWAARLRDIASAGRVAAKISGLSAAVGPIDSWTAAEVRPFLEDALDIFGPDRLMYGGDWPVSILAGGYEKAWGAIEAVLNTLDENEHARVLGGTAARMYGL